MLLFRSEEAVRDWCRGTRIPFGALLTVDQCWELGRIWYRGRMETDWRPSSVEEKQRMFDTVGLTGDFWSLAPG